VLHTLLDNQGHENLQNYFDKSIVSKNLRGFVNTKTCFSIELCDAMTLEFGAGVFLVFSKLVGGTCPECW
jgi:hypothetical protein